MKEEIDKLRETLQKAATFEPSPALQDAGRLLALIERQRWSEGLSILDGWANDPSLNETDRAYARRKLDELTRR